MDDKLRCALLGAVVCLVTLLSVADAALTIPMHSRIHRNVLALGPRGRTRANIGPNVTKPLHAGGHLDETFHFGISLGTPGQAMNLTVDFNRIPTFVFGSGTRGQDCYNTASQRHYFNPQASKTFVDSGESEDYPFAFYTECGWDISDGATDVTDTLTIGNVSVAQYPVIYTPKCSKYLNPDWPSDGVFGIANGYAMFQLMLTFSDSRISLFYKRGQSTSVSETAGAITIGGPDLENCEGDWYYVFTAADRGWSFGTDSFSFGSSTYKDGYYAYFLSYTTFIWTPKVYFEQIAKTIGAEYDAQNDIYTVDCSKVSTFPDMVFQITYTNDQSYEYRLPAEDYVRKFDPSAKRCTLMLQENDETEFGIPYWDLGTTFHRSHCIMFNYFYNGVAFAKAKQQ